MNTRKATMEYRLNQWIEVVRECRGSGKAVTSWCAEHDINPKKYYYWLKKVRTAACNTLPDVIEKEQQLVPLNVGELKKDSNAFIQTTQTAVIIRLNSAVVEIQNGATEIVIQNTLQAIKNLC